MHFENPSNQVSGSICYALYKRKRLTVHKVVGEHRKVPGSKKYIAFDDNMAVDLISWKWITRTSNYYENH